MKYYVKLFLLLACTQFAVPGGAFAQDKNTALIPGDFADPSIIRTPGGYYAVATSSEWAPHFPIYKSSDLKNWVQTGYVFKNAPDWTSGSFWAPEYYYLNGRYYLYYTARRKSDGHSYIGVATSKYPDRGFTDHGVLVAFGSETIDAFVYNDNGQLYITFKAYGLDNRPIEILASKLSADGLTLEGEPFSLLKDDERIGMEGQSILKKGNYYYLFYSAGDCCGTSCSYNVRVARSASFKGPYEKYAQNPLLSGNQNWECTGHGTFVNAGDGKTYYLHHAYNKSSKVFTGRQGLLAQLKWPADGGWPTLTDGPLQGKQTGDVNASFATATPAKYWQWDFRNSTPVIKQGNGKLTLSGTIKEGNLSGIALTVRPTSDNFEMTTTVTNHNAALKGLVFYGDAGAAVGIGVRGNNVEFWQVKDKVFKLLASQPAKQTAIQLKFKMQPDKACKAYYKQAGSNWTELVSSQASVDAGFLPQWDRSPRPGLSFNGKPGENAQFSSFRLLNL